MNFIVKVVAVVVILAFAGEYFERREQERKDK